MLNRFPTKQHQLGPPLLILCTSIVLMLLPDAVHTTLQYHSDLLLNGQVWRGLTGHLLHTNMWHLLLNALGLALLWSLHGDYYRWGLFLSVTGLLALGCTAGLLMFTPEMKTYVGLSGVLHGVFVWGALMDIRHKMQSGWILLIGIMVKIYFEQTQGVSESISTLINASVAIDAHLYGAITGFFAFGCCWVFDKKKVP